MDNLKELYQLLESDGINVDAIELAESLWLSKYISQTKNTPSSHKDNNTNTEIKEKEEDKSTPTDEVLPPSHPPASKSKQLKQKKRDNVPLHPVSDGDNKSSLPFRTPLIQNL